uniref:Uncharacterized protein n=1 Tax=Rhodosorus marinus TaxID=101924 RepID=A0A7S0BMR4_9RHOD
MYATTASHPGPVYWTNSLKLNFEWSFSAWSNASSFSVVMELAFMLASSVIDPFFSTSPGVIGAFPTSLMSVERLLSATRPSSMFSELTTGTEFPILFRKIWTPRNEASAYITNPISTPAQIVRTLTLLLTHKTFSSCLTV